MHPHVPVRKLSARYMLYPTHMLNHMPNIPRPGPCQEPLGRPALSPTPWRAISFASVFHTLVHDRRKGRSSSYSIVTIHTYCTVPTPLLPLTLEEPHAIHCLRTPLGAA